MKNEVEKILLNVINDFNSKWTSHDEKDAGVSDYAEKIVKLFRQPDVIKSVCTCIAFHKSDECYKLGCKVHRSDEVQTVL